MTELGVVNVRGQVTLFLAADFEDYRTFTPTPSHDKRPKTILDQVVAWSNALAPLQNP